MERRNSASRGSPRGSATASPFLSRSGSPVMIERGRPCLSCHEPETAEDARRQVFVGGVVLFLGLAMLSLSVVGYLVLRHDISSGVRTQATLRDNSTKAYREWQDNSFDPITLKAYFYNVLNPDELLQGARPALEEVGPFVYRDTKRRFDVEWSKDRSLLSYRTLEQFEFLPELSVAPDDERPLLVPNLPFLALQANLYPAGGFEREILANVYNMANYSQQDVLLTRRTPRELLFGYEDPILEELAHHAYPGILLNMTNETMAYAPSTIYSGVNAPPGRFRSLVEWRGEKVLQVCANLTDGCATKKPAWTTNSSSTVRGSDGSQLPPGVESGSTFELFSTAALRPVRMVNAGHERATYKGIHCLRFRLDPGELSNSTANRDFHQGGDLPSGFWDISELAANENLFVSMPHLKGVAEPAASSVVVSYAADLPEEGFVDVEPVTGSTMHLVQRSQLNFGVRPLPGMLNKAKNGTETWFPGLSTLPGLNQSIIPVVWFEDDAGIDDADAKLLRKDLYTAEELDHLALYVGAPFFFLCAVAGAWMLAAARRRLKELAREPLLPPDEFRDEPPGELLDGTGVGLYGSTGKSLPPPASAPVSVRPKARYASGPLTVSGSPRDIVHTRSPPGGPRSPSSSSRRPPADGGGGVASEVDISYA